MRVYCVYPRDSLPVYFRMRETWGISHFSIYIHSFLLLLISHMYWIVGIPSYSYCLIKLYLSLYMKRKSITNPFPISAQVFLKSCFIFISILTFFFRLRILVLKGYVFKFRIGFGSRYVSCFITVRMRIRTS